MPLYGVEGASTETDRQVINKECSEDVTGYFNIDLLQLNMCNKEHYGDFLDLMLGHSLFPKLHSQHRLWKTAALWSTLSPNYVSFQAGIKYSRISDQHPHVLSICPSNKISVVMNKKEMSPRGLIARLLTITSNNRCFKMIYQLPCILTPIAVQTSTTIFYTIIWRRWKTNISHIDKDKNLFV